MSRLKCNWMKFYCKLFDEVSFEVISSWFGWEKSFICNGLIWTCSNGEFIAIVAYHLDYPRGQQHLLTIWTMHMDGHIFNLKVPRKRQIILLLLHTMLSITSNTFPTINLKSTNKIKSHFNKNFTFLKISKQTKKDITATDNGGHDIIESYTILSLSIECQLG